MKLEELKKKINKCKDIELSSISLDDVDELTDIKIDKRDVVTGKDFNRNSYKLPKK